MRAPRMSLPSCHVTKQPLAERDTPGWLLRLEIVCLDVGLLLSLYTGWRLSGERWRIALPWALLMVALFALGVWLLLEPMQDDRGVGNPLEPRESAFHVAAVRLPPGQGFDASRPALGVLVFLVREPPENAGPPGIALSRGEMPIGGSGFYLPPPHLLDGLQRDPLGRHGVITP